MTLTFDPERDVIEASGRLGVYALLATGFVLPTSERLDLINSTLLPAVSILRLGDNLDAAIVDSAAAFTDDIGDLRVHHSHLFPPIASQDVPGYETGYRGEGVFQQSSIMADVAGFYRAHGLQSGGSERERIDHISVELDFMAFVAKKELLALNQGKPDWVHACQETAATFLQDHLGCWAPAFGQRVAAVSQSPWYAALGELLAAWIDWDMESMGVEPDGVFSSPLPQEPPDDGSCGSCPTPGLGAS